MIQKAIILAAAALLSPTVLAQWAAQPGETVRNAFGPLRGDQTTQCRGACGLGCPDSCEASVSYECMDSTRLRRVRTYECGSHEGCRAHDDCFDTCSKLADGKFDCRRKCDKEAVDRYGLEPATSWGLGRGPFEGPPITFEYTRDVPSAPEPAFRCPAGARRECDGAAGRCIANGGSTVEPVFDSYPSVAGGSMRVSDFRAGRLCGNRVCEQTADIRVTGQDSCARGSCTHYGIEFDYTGADPSEPLECSTSTSGGENDFIGNLLVKGLKAMPEQEVDAGQGEQKGMKQLLGVFKKVVESADSPEDVRISMAPLGPDGKPIESQRVGTEPDAGPPSIPRTVDLTSPSGHLVVPMYQLADGSEPLVREIRCSHKNAPVLETTFRLSF